MTDTRTITRRKAGVAPSYFGVFDVPETASSYRIVVASSGRGLAISLVNWGTCAEFGSLPTELAMKHSVAEHLTNGNLIDAENLIGIFRTIPTPWDA